MTADDRASYPLGPAGNRDAAGATPSRCRARVDNRTAGCREWWHARPPPPRSPPGHLVTTWPADGSELAALDGPAFRAAFRRAAAGVAVVTARGARPVGFAATSVTSVSLHPHLLSFNIARRASSWPTLAGTTHVGVHLLGEDQREIAERFAHGGGDRFAPPTRWLLGPHGVPILDDVLVWMVCRVDARVPAGDHVLVVAEAVVAEQVRQGRPLLYHDGRYTRLTGDDAPA